MITKVKMFSGLNYSLYDLEENINLWAEETGNEIRNVSIFKSNGNIWCASVCYKPKPE